MYYSFYKNIICLFTNSMSIENLYEYTVKLTLQDIKNISQVLKIKNKNIIKLGVESLLYIYLHTIEELQEFNNNKIIEIKLNMINSKFIYDEEESINVYVVDNNYTFEFYYKKIE